MNTTKMREMYACAALITATLQCAAAESDGPKLSPTTEPITAVAPAGWLKNGRNPSAYVVGLDREQKHVGAVSAYVKSIMPTADGFGGMMQMCAADKFVGKRLRFSAWMKTEDAKDGGAHLWFRIDGAERGATLGFDNMDPRPVKGTTDWQEYALVLDVPPGARALAYGFFVSGTGRAWVSGVRLEEVGSEVPTSNMYADRKPLPPGQPLPPGPVNLSFEESD